MIATRSTAHLYWTAGRMALAGRTIESVCYVLQGASVQLCVSMCGRDHYGYPMWACYRDGVMMGDRCERCSDAKALALTLVEV